MDEVSGRALRYRLDGKLFARGVACCLVEAEVGFEIVPLGSDGRAFVLGIDESAVRYLPAGYVRIAAGGAP